MKFEKYRLFGLNILSELTLTDELAEFDKSDVDIFWGKVNIDLDANYHSINDKSIRFVAKQIGKYEISCGNKITIEPLKNANIDDIKIFLFGTAFGLLMHQRREYPLHGSSLVINNYSFIFLGHSGAGKSSLALGFSGRGYRILSDDISRIEKKGTTYVVHHSYPSQKLCRDTLNHIESEVSISKRLFGELDKFQIVNPLIFEKEPKELKVIIEIYPSTNKDISLRKLNNKDALNALITHSYRQEFMSSYMDVSDHLINCVELMKKIKVYRLYRPQNLYTVKAQIDIILNAFQNGNL